MIEKNDLEILTINFRVMGEPAFAPDITRQEVVKAGGGDLATLASIEYKDGTMRIMAARSVVVVADNLHHNLVHAGRDGDVDMTTIAE